MNTYQITIEEILFDFTCVLANSKEEAIKKAKEEYKNGKILNPGPCSYSRISVNGSDFIDIW